MKVRLDTENNKKSKKTRKGLSSGTIWTIKITVITLALSFIVSFITEITSSNSNVVVAILVLLLLIAVSIIFDTIGVAATSCDAAPLLAMAAKKVKGAAQAVKLAKNAEKVSNICSDVVGDICGIISGSCSAAIVIMFAAQNPESTENPEQLIFSIVISSIVAAITVGGKAFFKTIAIKKSKELLLLTGKILSIFSRKK